MAFPDEVQQHIQESGQRRDEAVDDLTEKYGNVPREIINEIFTLGSIFGINEVTQAQKSAKHMGRKK